MATLEELDQWSARFREKFAPFEVRTEDREQVINDGEVGKWPGDDPDQYLKAGRQEFDTLKAERLPRAETVKKARQKEKELHPHPKLERFFDKTIGKVPSFLSPDVQPDEEIGLTPETAFKPIPSKSSQSSTKPQISKYEISSTSDRGSRFQVEDGEIIDTKNREIVSPDQFNRLSTPQERDEIERQLTAGGHMAEEPATAQPVDFVLPEITVRPTDNPLMPAEPAQPKPRSLSESLTLATNNYFQGLAQVPAGALKSIAIASKDLDDLMPEMLKDPRKVEDRFTYKLGQSIDRLAKQMFPSDPASQKEFVIGVLPQALGNMTGFMAGGVAGMAAKAPGTVAATLGAGVGGSSQYEEAKEFKADETTQRKAFWLGSAVGASEGVPIALLLNRFNKATGGRFFTVLKQTGVTAAQEAAQEWAQQVGSNEIARQLYDENRSLFENAGVSTEAGGATGAIVGLVTGIIQGRKTRKIEQNKASASSDAPFVGEPTPKPEIPQPPPQPAAVDPVSALPESLNLSQGQPFLIKKPVMPSQMDIAMQKAGMVPQGTAAQPEPMTQAAMPPEMAPVPSEMQGPPNPAVQQYDELVRRYTLPTQMEVAARKTGGPIPMPVPWDDAPVSEDVLPTRQQLVTQQLRRAEVEDQLDDAQALPRVGSEIPILPGPEPVKGKKGKQRLIEAVSLPRPRRLLTSEIVSQPLPPAPELEPLPSATAQPERDMAPTPEAAPFDEMVTLYRGEATPNESAIPDYIKEDPRYQHVERDVRGRWFTDDPEIAEWYKKEAGEGGRITTVEVPRSEVEQYRVSNQPDDIQRFSKDPASEFFVPKDIAKKASLRQAIPVPGDAIDADMREALDAPIDERAHEAATSPSNDRPEPSDAQREAGNFKLGHARIGGLDISIEHPEGSTRSGKDKAGKPWSSTMKSHYGYIRETKGRDKDHIDVFVRPGTTSTYEGPVFIVDQVDPDTGRFDETKTLIGFDNLQEAKQAYLSNYADDWNGLGNIAQSSMDGFKRWLKSGKTTAAYTAQPAKNWRRPEPVPTPDGALSAPSNVGELDIPSTKGVQGPSVDEIHQLADSKGMAWDNDQAFMDLTEKATGKRHLDHLTGPERRRVFEAISASRPVKKEEVAPSRAEVAPTPDGAVQVAQPEAAPTPDKAIASKVGRTVTLYRGSQEGSARGNFWSPDRKVAEGYAGKGVHAKVQEEDVTFANLLEASNWMDAKKKLGLGQDATMPDLVKAGEASQYDGITFKTKNGQEYIRFLGKKSQPVPTPDDAILNPLIEQPRSALPPEQNTEMLLRAEKANADLEIAGKETGRRKIFDYEVQGQGVTPEVKSLQSAAPDWYRELTTGPRPLKRAQIDTAIQKIIKNHGVDVGVAVERVKEALLRDREFNKTPWGEDADSIARGEWPSWIEKPDANPLIPEPSSKQRASAQPPVTPESAILPSMATDRGPGSSEGAQPPEPGRDWRDTSQQALENSLAPVRSKVPFTDENVDNISRALLAVKEEKLGAPSFARIVAANLPLPPENEQGSKMAGDIYVGSIEDNLSSYFGDYLNDLGIPYLAPNGEPMRFGKAGDRSTYEIRVGSEAGAGEGKRWYQIGKKGANFSTGIPAISGDDAWSQYEKRFDGRAQTFGDPVGGAGIGITSPVMRQRPELYDVIISEFRKDPTKLLQWLRKDLEFRREEESASLWFFDQAMQDMAKRSREETPEGKRAKFQLIKGGKTLPNPSGPQQGGPVNVTPPDDNPLLPPVELKPKVVKKAKPEQTSIPVPAEVIGSRPIIGREMTPEEAPLFSKAAQEKDAEQTTIDDAPPTPDNVVQVEGNKIDDVGEKIGGARKDLVGKSEPKAAKPKPEGPSWMRRYTVAQIAGSSRDSENGKWVIRDTKDTDFAGRPRQIGSLFDTEEEARTMIPVVVVSKTHRIYQDRNGKWEIFKRSGDRKLIHVVNEKFDTEEEAKRYLAQNASDILETKTFFGEEILPRPDTVRRVGKDRRKGRDVAANDFKEAFGFRAVEFGNWQNQDDRQEVMNHAYDGLHDLADTLNIPASAIGLNGDLALAFGSRGSGLSGAAAHYERNYGVINLTKMQGAGHLAHEWFHAADHYFGRQDTKASSEKEKNKRGDLVYKTKFPSDDYASYGFRAKDSKVRPEVREAYNALITTMFKKGEQYVEDTQKADKFVAEARQRVAEQLAGIRDTQYGALSKKREYGKRNNDPATSEHLAEFDAVANRILEGELFSDRFVQSDMGNKHKRYMLSGRWTNDALEKISAIYKAVRGRSGFGSGDQRGILDDLRTSMQFYSARLKMLADAQAGTEKTKQVPTSYAMEAKSMDQGRKESYWATNHEMGARAFAAYVEDKLKAEGKQSDFITYHTKGAVPTIWGWKKPYPEGDERSAINAAFDRFVGVLKTREKDGLTELYQSEGKKSSRLPREAEASPAAKELADLFKQESEQAKKSTKQIVPRIPVAPITGGPSVPVGEIILNLEKGIDGKLTVGKTRRGAAGVYKPGSSAAIIKYSGDLDSTAHELAGHFLDDKFGLVKEWKGQDTSPFDTELEPFWPHGSGSPGKSATYNRAEGVAEYLRAWIVNPDAAEAAAPQFTAHMKATLPDDIQQALKTFSTQVRQWAGNTAHAKIMAKVQWETPETGMLHWLTKGRASKGPGFQLTFGDQMADVWTDDLRPFMKALKYAKEQRGIEDMKDGDDPALLARLYMGANAKLDDIFAHGMFDSKLERSTPGGLTWLLEPLDSTSRQTINADMQEVTSLMIAQRTIEKGEQFDRESHISGIGAGIEEDVTVAQERVEHLKKDPVRYAKLQEAANRYRQWADANLRYLVEKGRLSQEQYEDIKANNEQYVAMQRLIEVSPGEELAIHVPRGSGKAIGSAKQPIKTFGGSDKDIKNPYLSLMDATNNAIREADRNEIMKLFRDILTTERGMYDGEPKDLASIGRQAKAGEKETIPIYVNGTKEIWQFHPDVYRALKGLNEHYVLPAALTVLPRILRATIVNAPPFALRNIIRDSWHRAVTSLSGSKPWDTLKVYSKEEISQLKRSGGDQAGHYYTDAKNYARAMHFAMDEAVHSKNSIVTDPAKLGAWAKKSGQGYLDLMQQSERQGRLSEYRRAFKKAQEKFGYDNYHAMLYAAGQARGLIDYAVAGRWMRVMNQMIPFSNAAVQGLRSSALRAKADPSGYALRFGAFALVPTLLNYAWNYLYGDAEDLDEYRQLPAYQRDLFWNFKLGPDLWLKVPKPFEIGVVATSFERMLDYSLGNEKAFDGHVGSMVKTMLPIDESSFAGPYQAIFQAAANYDFFRDRPIVPRWEENLDLELRSYNRASRLGQALQQAIGVDARKIDFVVQQQFGYLGRYAADISDAGRKDRHGLTLSATGMTGSSPASVSLDARKVTDIADERGIVPSRGKKVEQVKHAKDVKERDSKHPDSLRYGIFKKHVNQYYKSESNEERDRLAALVRDEAKYLREMWTKTAPRKEAEEKARKKRTEQTDDPLLDSLGMLDYPTISKHPVTTLHDLMP